MAVRTARLFGPVLLGAANNAVFLCPTDTTVIIKRLLVVNVGAGAVTWRAALGLTSGARFTATRTLAGNSEEPELERWWVLEPGDELTISVNTINAVVVSGHGTALDGVAPLP